MSKEFEALERIKNKEILIDIEMTNTFYNEYEDLHNSFDTLEKSLIAFEIIKEKEVDVHNFKEILIKQGWVYEQYLDEENDPNTSGHQFAYKLLTKEEFDLLKEVLS